jgi:hypothetical protein
MVTGAEVAVAVVLGGSALGLLHEAVMRVAQARVKGNLNISDV